MVKSKATSKKAAAAKRPSVAKDVKDSETTTKLASKASKSGAVVDIEACKS